MAMPGREINIRIRFFILWIVVMGLLIMASCSGNKEAASTVSCGGVAVTFSQANAIIQSSCATNSSCHGSGSRNGPGALLTYSQIYAARVEIKSSVASGIMPRGSTLSSDNKNAIVCWIQNGASNN